MPHDFDQADLLIFSDDPEALSAVPRPSPVHATTPRTFRAPKSPQRVVFFRGGAPWRA